MIQKIPIYGYCFMITRSVNSYTNLNKLGMKNLKTKFRKSSLSLSLSLIILIGINSCQEAGQEQIDQAMMTQKSTKKDFNHYEEKLMALSLIMGEVLKDQDARKELFEFAKLNGNQNEVTVRLGDLFENNSNSSIRKRSLIVESFRSLAANRINTLTSRSNTLEDLIFFIEKNNISVTAPYLAENFDFEGLSGITVSWWTQDFEDSNLKKNPDWIGETKAIYVDFSKDLLSFEDLAKMKLSKEFLVSDEYAKLNPTIVLGSFDIEENKNSKETNLKSPENLALQNFVYSANCSQLTENSVVALLMPEFRLTSSIRNWPHPDRITIVIVLGTNPGGNAQSNTILFEKEVKRSNAGRWLGSDVSFLINNWLDRQVDMRLLVFNKRPSNSDEVQVTVNVKINSMGQTETQYTAVGGWSQTQLHFSQGFNRCGTITDPFSPNNPISSSVGLKSYGGFNFRVERFNKFEFYLVPRIIL